MDYKVTSVNIQAGSNNDRYIWKYSLVRKHLKYLRHDKNVTEVEGKYFIIGIVTT